MQNETITATRPKKGAWDDTIKTIIIALLLAMTLRSCAYEPFHIPSGSMKSGLLVGDYLFVSKYAYGYSKYSFPFGLPIFEGRIVSDDRPERGDVVVFRPPTMPRVDFIKRVIGLPGDRIQVKNGILYINDKPLPRTSAGEFVDDEDPQHIRTLRAFDETLPEGRHITVLQERTSGYANNTPVFTVPEKHYFMMGDNRDNSRDSRFTDEVGFVPEENLIGRAEIIFFSTDGSAGLTEPWKWPGSLRLDRFFKLIH